MPTVDVDGASLVYDVTAGGEPTLAFVHGWCSKRAHWRAQVAALSPAHRTVCWDRRGMGASTTTEPASGPGRHADDLAAILDHERVDRVTVVGHAGGGPAALSFAASYPSRTSGLILVDTRVHEPPPGEDRFAAAIARSAAKLTGPEGDAYFRNLYKSFFGPRAAADVVEDAVENALSTAREVAAAEMQHITGDTASLARQVCCPVLWVSANPDDTAQVRGVFGDVIVGHVVGSGHFVQLEVPEQLNPMIEAFLHDEVTTS